jgi:hypothetical protein
MTAMGNDRPVSGPCCAVASPNPRRKGRQSRSATHEGKRAPAARHLAPVIAALSIAIGDTSLAASAGDTLADEPLSFTDPVDGKLDMSDFLLKHRGALPVPIVITEPAVGYGLGLGLLFFSGPMADITARPPGDDQPRVPPNVTALGGGYTRNGTWAAAFGHFHTWDGDRYRYLGGIAKVDAQLDYYGLSSQPRAYTLNGVALIQQLLVRIGESRWYAGPRYVYFDASSAFKSGAAPVEAGAFQSNQRISAASLVIDYDSRDNIFYPARGSFLELEAQAARTALGSTENYEVYAARGYTWLPVAQSLILGLRADSKFSSGDIPFYAQPYIDLRGVRKGRYQDRNALSAEVELRWEATPRWSWLAFTGLGKAWGQLESFSQAQNVQSVGAGFRYMIARKLGVSIGVDVAHSKDQNAIYIQVGSAWH